jgi:pilus assembly protein CpaF
MNGPARLHQEDDTDIALALGKTKSAVLERYPGLLAGARTDDSQRDRLKEVVSQLLIEQGYGLPTSRRDRVATCVTHEIVGYGPIEDLMNDPAVDEIMVNGPHQVFVEMNGTLVQTAIRFRDADHLLETINRMVAPLGRRIDQSCPYVDARLPGGSRANAIIPPLSLSGPVLTVRKFSGRVLSAAELVEIGTMPPEMCDFLRGCVESRLNILVSGGASSGKTTTLNALSGFINEAARIITIEDSAELRLLHPHVIRLEARTPNSEGRGEITVRDLLRNALRMRPDRIIVGEVRGQEAFDMLQAMNTGHDGSMSTVHANTCLDALRRLEAMAMMAGERVPHRAVREQVRSAMDVVIHLARLSDGKRRAMQVSLVLKEGGPAERLELQDVFRYRVRGQDPRGRVTGEFEALPRALPGYYKERLSVDPAPGFRREAS